MHFSFFDQSILEEYLHTGVLPLHIRPTHCTRCEAHSGFHRHSSYRRKCVFRPTGWVTPFFIQRFKCSSCGKVFSLIPDFIYKWQRLDLSLLLSLLQGPASGLIRENFSLRTIRRWKALWIKRAMRLQTKVLQVLLSLKPDLKIDVPAPARLSALAYLLALVDELPVEVPLLTQLLSVLHFGGRLSQLFPTETVIFSSD